MSPRVLVVGGAGFIGSALVRLLAREGEVRVLDDLSTGSRGNLDDVAGVELQVGSICDVSVVDAAMQGIDEVFHLACRGVRHSLHSPVENHQVNAMGTLNLLEAARAGGVMRFLYTSTSEVYGTARTVPIHEDHPTYPHTVYGGSKLAGEAYARAYHESWGLPTVVVRPFNAYGPRSHHEGDSGEVIPRFMMRLIAGEQPVIFGDGEQTRDFTYVEDTARGILEVARCDAAIGTTLNLGSGAEISISSLARKMAVVCERPDVQPLHVEPRPGDVLRLLADSGAAEQLTGWTPSVTLDEGLARLRGWHEERGTDWKQAVTEGAERNWESTTE